MVQEEIQGQCSILYFRSNKKTTQRLESIPDCKGVAFNQVPILFVTACLGIPILFVKGNHRENVGKLSVRKNNISIVPLIGIPTFPYMFPTKSPLKRFK